MPRLLPRADHLTPLRIARSVLAAPDAGPDLSRFHAWFAELGRHAYTRVERIPLDALADWRRDPGTGNLAHRSGRFFTVEGLDVHIQDGPVPDWSQPIIVQPEIGILGILAKEFDGVLHFLIQAKVEPGNCNGLQLSPTVQATRSNYTRVHQGRPVPYLEYFLDPSRHRVVADVRQSEQGSWFHRKRNRNMVVEVTGEVEVLDGFRWMTLGQIHRLLRIDNLVNMDARTVLSCLPFSGTGLEPLFAGDDFTAALIRSFSVDAGSLHSTREILSWITDVRTRTEIRTRTISLDQVRNWHRTSAKISHHSGRFFDVIGVEVTAGGREVGRWSQPMIEPCGIGMVAFLVTSVGGVLHALVHARVEPGCVDVAELAPTVQCTPENLELLPAAARPPFLDEVLGAGRDRIRFEAELSEEGGRFYRARNRYLVVETGTVFRHPDYRWMTLGQLAELLRHSNYINIQARSLVGCLHALSAVC